MRIIVVTATGLVLYAGETLTLNAERAAQAAENPDWIDPGTTTANAELVEVGALPANWRGGCFTYAAGEFTPTPAYAAQIAAVQAQALASAKVSKDAEINAKRLEANQGAFPYGGKLIAADTLSRSDIDGTNGYILLNGDFPPGWPGGWKSTDNAYVPITTVEQWKAFYGAMCAYGSANFAKAQTLKAQVAAATTVEAVNAVSWEA